jgi:hypothetical protein
VVFECAVQMRATSPDSVGPSARPWRPQALGSLSATLRNLTRRSEAFQALDGSIGVPRPASRLPQAGLDRGRQLGRPELEVDCH